MSSGFTFINLKSRKIDFQEERLILGFIDAVIIQKVMRYLKNLSDDQKYREQIRIYEKLNKDKKNYEDLLIQLFDYVKKFKAYRSALSEEEFKAS